MIYSEITGRLGADSELKTSKSGNQFVTMRVASNDFVGGENVTTWVRVLWSGDRAVKMQEHLKKGSLVSVRGTQRVSLYDTKNGEKAISFDIFADRVDFVGGGSGSTQSNESVTDTGTLKPKVEATSVAAPQEVQNESVDDLPF
jgi:single-stranded DNA-binding protein